MKRALTTFIICATIGTAAADPKREVPDYDGRGDPPTTVGDVLIWIPRVVVAPLYLIAEYVVRRPTGLLIETAERHRWVPRLIDYLNGPIGIVPTALIDLGLSPTVGFYFFWNDAIASNNQVRATASFGSGVISAVLLDRYRIPGSRWQLALRGAVSRRDEANFYGIGWNTDFDDTARYEDHRLEASTSAAVRFAGRSSLSFGAGMRKVTLHDTACCGDPSIGEAVAMGLFAEPPGFADGGYSGPFTRARLVLDSRAQAPGSGVGLTVDAEQGSDPDTDRVWLRTAVALAGSLELGQPRRVASLSVEAELAEPLEGDDVPFTELVSLGGSGPLPGFMPGRLIGRSAAAATLKYEWPVWAYLTGVAQVGAGNVFDEHFDDLELGRMRASAGFGMRSVGLGDHRFELLIALGTEPFDEGGGVDSVRLQFGGVIGF